MRPDGDDRGLHRRRLTDTDENRQLQHRGHRRDFRRPRISKKSGCIRRSEAVEIARPAARKPVMAVEAVEAGVPA
jgi:hypothetical protein